MKKQKKMLKFKHLFILQIYILKPLCINFIDEIKKDKCWGHNKNV